MFRLYVRPKPAGAECRWDRDPRRGERAGLKRNVLGFRVYIGLEVRGPFEGYIAGVYNGVIGL